MNYLLTSKLSARLYAGLTIAALLLSALPVQFFVVQAAGGAIWTTKNDCGTEAQDANQFEIAEGVYINGSGFAEGSYDWAVTGQPGGASADPGQVVADGQYSVDSTGDFCFKAYTVASDDDGTYTVDFGNKNDNYRVNGVTPPETAWLIISKELYDDSFPGTLDEADFDFHITGTGVDVTVAHGDKVALPVGTYSVTESYTGTDPIGFDAEDWKLQWFGNTCNSGTEMPVKDAGTIVLDKAYPEDNPARCTASNTFDPEPVVPTDMTFELVKKFSGPVPEGYTADQFTFNIAGVANDIALTAQTDDYAYATITLPVGTYEISENGPAGFAADEWVILWAGAGCENVTAPTTMITVGTDDLSKTNFGCLADNQWKPDTTVPGCTDPKANNYNEAATYNDGSCTYDEPNQCLAAAPGWADEVVSADQGETKGAGAIADPKRTDPDAALGASDWSNGDSDGFYSLGFGGSVVFSFGPGGFVTDEEGNDISIHEATNGDSYPEEKALIEVSQDGSTWYEVGTASNLTDVSTRVSYFDIATSGLAWIKYVRVTDTTDPALHVPAADGFDLDAVDTTKTVCEEPDNGGGNGNNDGDTYIIEGYVWHDENQNTEWDGFGDDEEATTTEDQLVSWTVKIVNEDESQSFSTTTDPTGYYYFEVPAGTWTISETIQDGWELTTPVDNQYVVTVPEVLTQSIGQKIFAFLIPTAHAAVQGTYGLFNFGNVTTSTGGGGSNGGSTSGGGSSSGGGGGSLNPVCESLELGESGGLYTLSWETRRGDELTITQNGTQIYFTDTDADVDNGSALVTTNNADFELTVSRGSREDTCTITSTNGAPEGQVLGEQVSVVPLGAADAGAGGTSIPAAHWITLLIGGAVRPREDA